MLPFVTVIISAYNAEKMIEDCLTSLLNQTYSPDKYEIIVVDDGSTDRTSEIVSSFPVKLFVIPHSGVNRARMEGVQRGRGETVAFTDSDCVADRNWLQTLVLSFTEEDIGAVGGRVLPYKGENTLEKYIAIMHGLGVTDWGPKSFISIKEPGKYPRVFPTANFAVKRKVLEATGGFDLKLRRDGDAEFQFRVLNMSYKLFYQPNAIVWHKHRTTLWKLLKQQFNYGAGATETESKPYRRYDFKIPFYRRYNLIYVGASISPLIIFMLLREFIAAVLSIMVLYIYALLRIWGKIRRQNIENIKASELLLFPLINLLHNLAYLTGRIYGHIYRFRREPQIKGSSK